MKRVLLLILVCLAVTGYAWSGHDALTYKLLFEFDPLIEEFVQIKPYTYSDIDTQPYNPEITGFYDYLGESYTPGEDFDLYRSTFPNPSPVNGMAPIWQILSVYSYEPDLGMDKGLELKGIETLLGDSQGLRHMEYRLLYFIRVGEVTDMVQYFSDLAETAYSRGDYYWAYRFMARSIHYLEDVGQPFHTFPAPLIELVRLPFNSKKWLTTFANFHYAMDFYGGYLLWGEYPPLMKAIAEAPMKTISSPKQAALDLRSYSRGKLNPVYYELKALMNDKLESTQSVWPGKAYFDGLFESGKAANLNKMTVEILAETTSYVKGYVNYMFKRFEKIRGS